jgi:cell division protein FtsB
MQEHQTPIIQFDVQRMFDRVCQLFYSSRRKLATGAVFVLVILLGFHVIFGTNGMVVYTHKRAEYRKLLQETEQIDEEHSKLEKQVDRMKHDPEAIEEEARNTLGYTKKGEIVYTYDKPAEPSKNATANSVKP